MIPAVGDDGFKFLGMLVRVHNNNNDAHASLPENLKRMLEAVDRSPVTCHDGNLSNIVPVVVHDAALLQQMTRMCWTVSQMKIDVHTYTSIC